jgi:DNA-binding NarL/FixJ family response regulator
VEIMPTRDSARVPVVDQVPTSRVKVLIFESSQMSCELLSHALEASPYAMKVVGVALGLESEGVGRLIESADVAIISSTLKDGALSGFTLLRRLLKNSPNIHCVMLLDQGDRDLVIEAFRSGAVGVCERSQSYEMLCKCVHSVQRGQVWANSQQLRYLLDALSSGMPGRVTDSRGQVLLTRREDEIVALVTEGLKNREIAETLKISEHTVKNHLFRIFERLGISSRAELILYLLGRRNVSGFEPNAS